MLRQGVLIFLLLLASSYARHYIVSKNLEITEIPSEMAEYALQDPNIAGLAEYDDDRKNSGWVYYYIKTDSSSPDWLQSYVAGYMEGDLAYEPIWDVYSNNLLFINELSQTQQQDAMEFMHNQTNWIRSQIASNPGDEYWDLVNTTLAQQQGMYDGYMAAIKRAQRQDMSLTYDQFYLNSYNSDYFDVAAKFVGSSNRPPKCSFLARITNENLYVSHTTWFDYIGLLRVYKVYDLFLQNSLVQTQRISYSGQPGYASSQDDFYILDNGKFVSETSLNTDNNDVFSWIHYDSIPYWIRVTVANYMYDTQQNWVNTFFAHRSGTYNNQWLIVDFNKFNASKGDFSAAKDIIWLVEEFYSLTSAQDVTQTLLIPQGFVGSYNVPYDPQIQALSQNPTNYTNDPRAILFGKYAPTVQTLDDFRNVMRRNNISDTGSYCEAIAARCDLQNPNKFPMGALDCKVTSDSLATTHQAYIIAGPTTEVVFLLSTGTTGLNTIAQELVLKLNGTLIGYIWILPPTIPWLKVNGASKAITLS